MRRQSALSRVLLVVVASLGCLKTKPIPHSGPSDASSGCCPTSAVEEKQPLDENEVAVVIFGKDEGTQERPILVNQANIEAFNRHANTPEGLKQHYQLTENIVLPNKPSNWTPIGTQDARFNGSFDGGGFTITNLHMDAPNSDHQGLFGYIGLGALIRNLGVIGGTVSGNDSVGGVVGLHFYGTVQGCYATSNVNGKGAVGGVVGKNDGRGTVQNCYATGSVNGDNSAGGVVGMNKDKKGRRAVQSCVALSPSVTQTDNTKIIGRVVGDNQGKKLSGNYARDNMVLTMNDKPHPSSNSFIEEEPGCACGCSIANPQNGSPENGRATSKYNSEDFWRTTMRWDFSNIWQWGDSLPILRNVEGVQNPTVK
ncbi:MAG: hypothetical protein FWC28_02585 [Proteobacteria bacterium]|nr:hypothetical protein [Cystobacterineae bacterium]MCL2314125.1 hypothetical protein [Pseudomonadota bacterium]